MKKTIDMNELIMATRGVEDVYDRTCVLMLAYESTLDSLNEIISYPGEAGEDTMGLPTIATELNTLSCLFMREFNDLKDVKDKLLGIVNPK